jgi:hypothetical protein
MADEEQQADIERYDIPKGVKKAVKDGPLDASDLEEHGREGKASDGNTLTGANEDKPHD